MASRVVMIEQLLGYSAAVVIAGAEEKNGFHTGGPQNISVSLARIETFVTESSPVILPPRVTLTAKAAGLAGCHFIFWPARQLPRPPDTDESCLRPQAQTDVLRAWGSL